MVATSVYEFVSQRARGARCVAVYYDSAVSKFFDAADDGSGFDVAAETDEGFIHILSN